MAAFKSLSFSFALTIWVAFYSLQAAASTAGIGSWKPIKNLTDPSLVKIAYIAVAMYNQKLTATKLGFVSLIKGDTTQVVAGLNYRLVISARESDSKSTKPGKYLAIVYEKFGDTALKLMAFYKLRKN